jgi:hypothetical protein
MSPLPPVVIVCPKEFRFTDATASVETPFLADVAALSHRLARFQRPIPDAVLDAHAIILWHGPLIDAAVIARLKNCRVIIRNGVGFDTVDIAAAAKRRHSRVQRARLRHRGSRRPRHRPHARPLPPALPARRRSETPRLENRNRRQDAPPQHADLRRPRPRPHRHRRRPARQSDGVPHDLLRPLRPERHPQSPRRGARRDARRTSPIRSDTLSIHCPLTPKPAASSASAKSPC